MMRMSFVSFVSQTSQLVSLLDLAWIDLIQCRSDGRGRGC